MSFIVHCKVEKILTLNGKHLQYLFFLLSFSLYFLLFYKNVIRNVRTELENSGPVRHSHRRRGLISDLSQEFSQSKFLETEIKIITNQGFLSFRYISYYVKFVASVFLFFYEFFLLINFTLSVFCAYYNK